MSVATLQRWLRIQAVVWPPWLAVCAWSTSTGGEAAGLLATAALIALVSAGILWRILRIRGGVADLVTGARLLLLVAAALAVALEARITWVAWTGLLVAVGLDLVDGWCARRFGSSDAGAILDMECDQFAVTLLAIAAAGFAAAGPWILLLPAMKHGHVLLLTARRLPAHDPKPRDGDNRVGRWICAGVLIALLVATAPVTPHPVVTIVGLAAVAALAWSFGRDLVYLLRRRHDHASVPG